MKIRSIWLGFIMLMLPLGLLVQPASAQELQPSQLISINKPISAELRTTVENWLVAYPPSTAVYYAITYTQPIGFDTYVSLVGLNIASPDDFWSVVGDEFGNQQVIWMDTIRVYEDGTITFPFTDRSATSYLFPKFADLKPLPNLGAGGGAYVRFPWQPAKAVQYGILGVHDADYGTDGGTWGAIDLVSGSDMGSGAANDSVYASVSGTITTICDYEDTVAVQLTGGGDSFLYAHLLPNANLVIDHSFQAGQLMGTLKHGSFTDECGNAIQKDNHWHLHWGFVKNSGKFQAEGCFLQGIGPASAWKCGNTNIKVLGYLYHYGNIGINPDDGTVGYHGVEGAGGGPSFWAYFLNGAKGIFDALFMNNLPEHSSVTTQLITPIMNGVKIVFRIAQVLLRGNLNLAPAAVIVVLAITIKLSLTAITFAGYIYRIIKSVPFA